MRPAWLERDPNPPAWRVAVVYLLALAAAGAASAAVFAVYGAPPGEALGTLLSGTLGSAHGLAETARRAIPLLLIGSGLALCFRAQFFNVGGDGQLLTGAVAATGVALFVPLPPPLALPAMFAAAFAGGALWILVPALLRARLGVNEILTTLMLNHVAAYGVLWLVQGPWKGATVRGFPYTDPFPAHAQLPVLSGTRVHWPTLLLGVAAAVALQVLLRRTPFGYELRVVGHSPAAARYAGIPGGRVLMGAALLSGGLAGLAGAGEVAGVHHRLLNPAHVALGYGYTATVVAWLARGHPALTLLTAPFLGLVFAGGDVLKVALRMPFRVVDVFTGLILLCVVAAETAAGYRLRRAGRPGGAPSHEASEAGEEPAVTAWTASSR